MNTTEILDSITIFCSSDEVPPQMKDALLKSNLDLAPLLNTTIIAVENTINGARMQSCTGIDMAYKMLVEDSEKKIILYHVLPVSEIQKRKEEKFDFVMSKPNVRLLEMPMPPETMISAFDSRGTDVDILKAKEGIDIHIRGVLSSIWHDIKKAPNPLNPSPGFQAEMVEKGIRQAKEAFPMLAEKDIPFILTFLEELSAVREEVKKGENLDGIFCDMEGTLFSNGVLNQSVLQFLKTKEAEGKKVTLWTDGNLAELQLLLDANNILYPLHAKRNFAGAIIEMAIDDMDQHSFTAVTKMYARTFVRVQDIH